jgi:hypothetical protein
LSEIILSVFFKNLDHNTPALESLEVSARMEYKNWPMHEYRNGVMLYSQKLQKLTLTNIRSCDEILDFLSPFWTENVDHNSSPQLSWPCMRHFHIVHFYDHAAAFDGRLKDMVLTVGRAVRYMPVLKSLYTGLTIRMLTLDDGFPDNYLIQFALEIS